MTKKDIINKIYNANLDMTKPITSLIGFNVYINDYIEMIESEDKELRKKWLENIKSLIISIKEISKIIKKENKNIFKYLNELQ